MKQKKVLVAMSGGVDSSVAAALLLKNGYDVTGVFVKQWSDAKEMNGVCTWKEDRRDALRVAAHLGIPLLTWDFEKEYKDTVLAYMFAEYRAGRTPNPDVLCNTAIKFKAWLDKALTLGFDALATGHYAQIEKKKGKYILARSVDEEKDQTYFLHQLTKEQLDHVVFPIGGYKKEAVRQLARSFSLPTAEREESMGICFVGEMPMKTFLQQQIQPTPGAIILSTGEQVGAHDGLPFYTIGQRHLKLPQAMEQKVGSRPVFVVAKRHDTNELVVGFEDDPLLYKQEIAVTDLHWVSGQEPSFPVQCMVRLRHRQELQSCTVEKDQDRIVVHCDVPQRAPTPGQFAVFYTGNVCLGGGCIA
ncbi:MAG TPA: tRNA 2-thiouridine(34) synthase MnmA [Candidatus Kapabacteria bacterium]|nr:tRNA 2-thiouridine(34) synthase MnmA [Candidatus Kapabacteria bacterium]